MTLKTGRPCRSRGAEGKRTDRHSGLRSGRCSGCLSPGAQAPSPCSQRREALLGGRALPPGPRAGAGWSAASAAAGSACAPVSSCLGTDACRRGFCIRGTRMHVTVRVLRRPRRLSPGRTGPAAHRSRDATCCPRRLGFVQWVGETQFSASFQRKCDTELFYSLGICFPLAVLLRPRSSHSLVRHALHEKRVC